MAWLSVAKMYLPRQKGPSLKIAKDSEGNWTKAALGFIKGQGASQEDVIVESIKGEDYIFVNKHLPGKAADQVLSGLNRVLEAMTFPVTMTWHDYETPFYSTSSLDCGPPRPSFSAIRVCWR